MTLGLICGNCMRHTTNIPDSLNSFSSSKLVQLLGNPRREAGQGFIEKVFVLREERLSVSRKLRSLSRNQVSFLFISHTELEISFHSCSSHLNKD